MPIGTAVISSGFKLSYGATPTEIPDIMDYPDLIGEPDMQETTTMGDGRKTFTAGLEGDESLPFTCLFSGMGATTNWGMLKVIADTKEPEDFTAELSTGDKFTFSATVRLGKPGNSPGNVETFIAYLMPTTAVTPVAAVVTP